MRYTLAKQPDQASKRDVFHALAHTIRQRLIDGILQTEERYRTRHAKRLVYLSAEFLIGQSLRNNLYNLGLLKESEAAVSHFGFNLNDIVDTEPDAALGNGGLGRLAACFMESLATLGMPAHGFGINYQFGLFKQEIENGYQKEKPEQWASHDSPWLIKRPDQLCAIPLYGRIEHSQDLQGGYNPMWVDWQVIVGVPYDLPIAGFHNHTVNYLRLYSARASDEFDMQIFNEGDYLRAVERSISMERFPKSYIPQTPQQVGKNCA